MLSVVGPHVVRAQCLAQDVHGVLVGGDDARAAAGRGGAGVGDREEVQVPAAHRPHGQPQLDHRARAQPVVGGQERGDRVDGVGQLARVAQSLAADQLVGDSLEHGLLIAVALVMYIQTKRKREAV